MRCGRCGEVLVEIRTRIGGTEVVFPRCSRCDSQTWETADGEIALDEVLDLARHA